MPANISKNQSEYYSAQHFLEEVASRVVAKSGIPTDRYHMGKIILQSLKDAPDFVSQIDGALDESETNRSVLERSVRCAIALKNLGLKHGDVMIIMAPNHLDLAIPFYAASYLGIIIAGIDYTMGVRELEDTFEVHKPNIIFCQSEKASDVELALKKENLKTHIITFDKGSKFQCFGDLLQKNTNGTRVEDFQATDFDTEETVFCLTATSGTTGLPKAAMLTHKNLLIALPLFLTGFQQFPTPTRLYIFVSPLQWLSAGIQYTSSPIFRYTRLQTSAPATKEHVYDLINKYRPTCTLLSPTYMTTLMTQGDRDKCDFSSFENILLGGSHVSTTLMETVKSVASKVCLHILYGMSETNLVCVWDHKCGAFGSLGKPFASNLYKLIDPLTFEEVDEPNVPGELWVKGPTVFKGYYNNPEMTKSMFSEDGWARSGDLLSRDSNYNYFYVDRLKMLLKYRNHQISPVEVEGVIREHPGVHDVVVVGYPDDECGDLPTAYVVPRPGCKVTAQEIKDLVKKNLADSKQLRGGVIFMKELPVLVNSKVDRTKLKKIVTEMNRE